MDPNHKFSTAVSVEGVWTWICEICGVSGGSGTGPACDQPCIPAKLEGPAAKMIPLRQSEADRLLILSSGVLSWAIDLVEMYDKEIRALARCPHCCRTLEPHEQEAHLLAKRNAHDVIQVINLYLLGMEQKEGSDGDQGWVG